MERLLTIGEFAQQSGLSRSALRFYDQNGLLAPKIVDPETGYRYYATSQLTEALLVRRLRGAEMPVASLRAFMAASPVARAEILDRHARSFRERARAVEDLLAELGADCEVPDRVDGENWCAVSPGEFVGAVEQLSFAVGDGSERAELGVIWVETREESLRLVATDSFRLAVRDLVPGGVGPGTVRGAIDADASRDLAIRVQQARSLVLAQDDGGALCALVDGQRFRIGGPGEGFPDYERILSELPLGDQAVVTRSELEEALVHLTGADPQVALTFGADGLVLESGGVAVSAGGTWAGPELTVWLDRQFMTEAVRATVGPDVAIEAVDALAPVTLRSADTGTFSVLTMPVRPPHPV